MFLGEFLVELSESRDESRELSDVPSEVFDESFEPFEESPEPLLELDWEPLPSPEASTPREADSRIPPDNSNLSVKQRANPRPGIDVLIGGSTSPLERVLFSSREEQNRPA